MIMSLILKIKVITTYRCLEKMRNPKKSWLREELLPKVTFIVENLTDRLLDFRKPPKDPKWNKMLTSMENYKKKKDRKRSAFNSMI
jgi:hypothetical protein